MTSHDVMMILVYIFPMFLFAIAPALKLGDYLEEKYGISETQKRTVMVVGTFLVSLVLAVFLQFGHIY
ncbi:MAG: hypothetical protein B5M52_05050 [Helicobacteraceae bacterium 4484_230]|nr:MAG: hypothetical protein B5M52_05050 [Helicobacteraceae bacterium 4484_230]